MTGLVGLPLWLTVGACSLLVLLAVVGDRPPVTAAAGVPLDGATAGTAAAAPAPPAVRTRKVDVVLDGAFGTVAAARAEVEARLDVDALDVVLDEVDYVREVTRVRVISRAGRRARAGPRRARRPPRARDRADEHHEEYAQYAEYGVPAEVDPTVAAARLPLQLPPPQDVPTAPWGRPRTRQPEPGRRARRLGPTDEVDVRGGYAEATGLSRLLGPVDPR